MYPQSVNLNDNNMKIKKGYVPSQGLGRSWSTVVVLSCKEKTQTISSIQLRCMAWKEKLKRDYKYCGSEKVTIVYTFSAPCRLHR
jgi:hypothetical protein